jgi:hypothetical protein
VARAEPVPQLNLDEGLIMFAVTDHSDVVLQIDTLPDAQNVEVRLREIVSAS